MKIFEIIAEDKKTWTKDGVEMCSKKCCGEPVTECTCGKDCKHCECYKINEAKLNEAGPAIIPMIIGVFEVANVTYTAYQMYTKEKPPVDPGPIVGKPTPGKIRQANKLKPNLDLRPRPTISKHPRPVEPRIK